jgi:hypothetical protein
LLEPELDQFWLDASQDEEKIGFDAFVKIFQDIDDLFVEVEDGDDYEEDDDVSLDQVFKDLCNDDGFLTKDDLREWDEVRNLLVDNLMSEKEFEDIWNQTPKQDGSDRLDIEGFLRFNDFLEDLFVFEEDEDEDDATVASSSMRSMVVGGDLPPGVIFAALANDDYLVGREDLSYWQELQEMLNEGDLAAQELQDMIAKFADKDGNLSEQAFIDLYNAIDDLFEDDDEEGDKREPEEPTEFEAKQALLDFLDELADDEDRLPCGLEADEREEKLVQNIVSDLEKSSNNRIQQTLGDLDPQELVGEWKLLYSSSSAMKFNKGLSGLGGSFPNGRFGGLVQKLKYSKFMQDVDYQEQIDLKPDTASFKVNVNGAWELRKSTSLFTNQPCTMLCVEPDRVSYGPTSTRADHWKSLGPMNLLDITYLDGDLRIMRGNTATDAIFVFQRIG